MGWPLCIVLSIFCVDGKFVLITIPSFPHSWLIIGFVRRVTQSMSLEELFTFLEHQSSPMLTVGFMLLNLRFSLQCYVDHCLCLFSFDHIIVSYVELRLLITPLLCSNFSIYLHKAIVTTIPFPGKTSK